MIVGIDVGKYQTRVVHQHGMYCFKSKLYAYRPLRLENDQSRNDLIIEFRGERYLGGDLGEREGEVPIQYTDESKAHLTTLINLLAGLRRLDGVNFQIVVGSPISIRNDQEKQRIKEMVIGTHKIVVNGNERVIRIAEVEVGPEGAAGFYSEPRFGDIQGFDFGSTTTNYFYISDKRFIDKKSGTFPFGAENTITGLREMFSAMASQLSNRFQKNNPTMILGGKAEEMYPIVREYYPHSYIARDPIFATAKGFYAIARAVYG